jgi:hypothetical protein
MILVVINHAGRLGWGGGVVVYSEHCPTEYLHKEATLGTDVQRIR